MALRFPKLRINRLWLLLGAAIILGVLAAVLSVNYLKAREKRLAAELEQKSKGGPTIAVVVPNRELPKGTALDQQVVAAREVPADLLADDTVTADSYDKIAGRRLLKAVLPGRPLRFSDIQDERAQDLSTSLKAGWRAITIEIDEINSFAQMLKAGNFVDLYLLASDPSAASVGQEVRPLLPKVKVIATGQTLVGAVTDPATGQARPTAGYTNITVEVSPAQAARIALAQQVGRLRAVLRNPDDTSPGMFAALPAAALFKAGNQPAVEYIIGGKGSGGAAAPVSINMPNISIPGLNLPGAPGASASPGQSSAFAGQPAAIGASVPSVPTGTR